MRTFIEKLCDRYKVSETDVQSLLNYMEEVHFKKRDLIVREGTRTVIFILSRQEYGEPIIIKTEWILPSGLLQTEKLLSPSGAM